MSKKATFVALVIPVPLALAALAIYLSVIYIPSWYQPQHITAQDERQLIDEFTELSRLFNNGMQTPQPFTLELTQKQANRFIAGRGLILPQLKELIPDEIIDPVVAWEDDWLKFGAVVEYHGQKLLASIAVKIKTDDEFICLTDTKVKVGAWPVPGRNIEEFLRERHPDHAADNNLASLIQNRQIPNRFSYANSDFYFRIGSVMCEDHKLRITIIPIRPSNTLPPHGSNSDF
jgi:hypothetical protein